MADDRPSIGRPVAQTGRGRRAIGSRCGQRAAHGAVRGNPCTVRRRAVIRGRERPAPVDRGRSADPAHGALGAGGRQRGGRHPGRDRIAAGRLRAACRRRHRRQRGRGCGPAGRVRPGGSGRGRGPSATEAGDVAAADAAAGTPAVAGTVGARRNQDAASGRSGSGSTAGGAARVFGGSRHDEGVEAAGDRRDRGPGRRRRCRRRSRRDRAGARAARASHSRAWPEAAPCSASSIAAIIRQARTVGRSARSGFTASRARPYSRASRAACASASRASGSQTDSLARVSARARRSRTESPGRRPR